MTTGKPVKRGAVRASRKGEILDRFAETVADRGYEQTAIGDIANELGMSKGTIVHHYGSKLALLEKVHREFMQRRLLEGRAIVERLSNPADQLSAMIYCLLLVYREDRHAALTFTREIVLYASDPAMTGVRTLRYEYTELLSGILERGMAAGKFRVEDPTLVTLQVFGMCNWGWTWIRPDSHDIEHIAAVFARTFLAGLAVDRTAVTNVLHDPQGKVPALVRELMRESAQRASSE